LKNKKQKRSSSSAPAHSFLSSKDHLYVIEPAPHILSSSNDHRAFRAFSAAHIFHHINALPAHVIPSIGKVQGSHDHCVAAASAAAAAALAN
jgi:hypothetical protein